MTSVAHLVKETEDGWGNSSVGPPRVSVSIDRRPWRPPPASASTEPGALSDAESLAYELDDPYASRVVYEYSPIGPNRAGDGATTRGRPIAASVSYGPVTELVSIAYVSVANAMASEFRSRTSLLLFENVSHASW